MPVRFSRFLCRLGLQSTILHTLQYAVGVQAAAGLVPTERLVPPYDVKPTQCHFNFSSLITLGPYNLTARTQIKAVENNLGERSKLYLDGWFMILIDQLRSKLLNQMRSRLGEKKTS